MKKIVCRLDYHKFSTSSLDTFVIEVRNGIFTNAGTFTTPPFLETEYEIVQEKYNNAASDYAQYGLTKKVAFIDAKEDMIQTLDKLAAYVDTVANGNVSTIALSGFVPTSDVVHPTAPLGKIDSFEISLTKISGEVSVVIPPFSNQTGVNYICVCVEDKPLVNSSIINGRLTVSSDDGSVSIDCNRSRQKMFTGLTPGTKYYFYAFAINATNVAPLSNPQSIYVS